MPSALWQRVQWRIRIMDRTVTGAIMGRAHIMVDMAMVDMAMAGMAMADMDRPTTAAVGAAAMLRRITAGGGQVITAEASEAIAAVGAEAARIMEVAVGVAEAVGIMGVVVGASNLS